MTTIYGGNERWRTLLAAPQRSTSRRLIASVREAVWANRQVHEARAAQVPGDVPTEKRVRNSADVAEALTDAALDKVRLFLPGESPQLVLAQLMNEVAANYDEVVLALGTGEMNQVSIQGL